MKKALLFLVCAMVFQTSIASADIIDPDRFYPRPNITSETQVPKLNLSKEGNQIRIDIRFSSPCEYSCVVQDVKSNKTLKQFAGKYENRRHGRVTETFEYSSPARYLITAIFDIQNANGKSETVDISKMVIVEDDRVFIEAID